MNLGTEQDYKSDRVLDIIEDLELVFEDGAMPLDIALAIRSLRAYRFSKKNA